MSEDAVEFEVVRALVVASLGEWLQYGFSTDPNVTDRRVKDYQRMVRWVRSQRRETSANRRQPAE